MEFAHSDSKKRAPRTAEAAGSPLSQPSSLQSWRMILVLTY